MNARPSRRAAAADRDSADACVLPPVCCIVDWDDGDGCHSGWAVSPSDDATAGVWWYRSFPDGTAIRYRIFTSDATRAHPDGGGRQYVTGTDLDSAAANANLRHAAHAAATGCVPDLDAARERLYTARAPIAHEHADGRLSGFARRVVRLARRAGDVADTYTGPEYELEPMSVQ